jgi:GNAT superfamily N-acetyltransferase
MIKLKDLLPEISLMQGNASESGMTNLFRTAADKVLPIKYGLVRKLLAGYYDMDDEDDVKEKESAEKLALVNDAFISTINSKLPLVARSGGYELRKRKSGKIIEFHLVDPKAKYVYEYFIGIIEVEPNMRSYRIDSKKAFNLNCYQIHWSNVAKEHQGKGLGKLMYTLVYQYVNQAGGALVSDSILFQGSQKMWFDYIPSIASFFGIVVNEIFFPIDKSEISRDILGSGVDHVVAMENPPKEIRKIAHNVKGLSFKGGQYGMIRVRAGVNDKIELNSSLSNSSNFWDDKPTKKSQYTLFSNMVDDAPTIIILLKRMQGLEIVDVYEAQNWTGEPSNLKACIFSFTNANVIVKETGGRLVMVAV